MLGPWAPVAEVLGRSADARWQRNVRCLLLAAEVRRASLTIPSRAANGITIDDPLAPGAPRSGDPDLIDR